MELGRGSDLEFQSHWLLPLAVAKRQKLANKSPVMAH